MADTAELITKLLDAFGDADAIDELLSDDAEWWITPTVGILPSPCRGRTAIHASMKVIFGQIYTEARAEVHMVIAQDERASARFTLRAMADTGERSVPYENEYCIWIEREGDTISRVWEYLDVAHAQAQLAGERGS